MKNLRKLSHYIIIIPPFAWLIVFVLLPSLLILKISFAESTQQAPPFTPLLNWVDGHLDGLLVSLENYKILFGDSLYIEAMLISLEVAALATVFCLLLGYPMAWVIARSKPRNRIILLMMIMLPFWTSFLIRIYSWIGIFKTTGVLNTILLYLNIIETPLQILNTNFAVQLGIVYTYLPFMILPLYATLEKMDGSLIEAALDLGATPSRAFLSVTLPLSAPGIIAGVLLVFIPAAGEYVIPELLGGPDTLMIGKVLWAEFSANNDWPLAASIAILVVAVFVAPMAMIRRLVARNQGVEADAI